MNVCTLDCFHEQSGRQKQAEDVIDIFAMADEVFCENISEEELESFCKTAQKIENNIICKASQKTE